MYIDKWISIYKWIYDWNEMSDKVKFDVEINKKFSDNIIINYGIVNGNNTIVFMVVL